MRTTVAFVLTGSFVLSAHNSSGAVAAVFPPGLRPDGLTFSIFLFLGLIVPLAIHELGHLLTGLAHGFRFEMFVVFLLGIRRTEKGVKVYLNKNLGYMGGIAATTPIKQNPGNRKKFARVVIAGPVASLLFAIVCFVIVIYTRNMSWSFWLIAGACSFSLFLATTLPTKSGIFFTDRARFQRLISDGKAGDSEEALIRIIAQNTIDNSSKNISLKDTRTLQNDDEKFIRFWGYYYEYQYFKANGMMGEEQESKSKLISQKDSVSAAVWKALKIE